MKLPDGPQTPPFLQLIQWIARPLELMETCAQRYGDTFTLRLGRLEPLVFLSNPQAIQEIFTAQPEQFEVGRGLTFNRENPRPIARTLSSVSVWGRDESRTGVDNEA